MKDIADIRADFPMLGRKVYNKPLIYLDNAATTQKPLTVIEAIRDVYMKYNGNIHRGVHIVSDIASEAFEDARENVRSFINAAKKEEIVFTSGATASINCVAYSFGERFVREGDEIVISTLEHHANIVPWQMMCERKGALLRVIPVDDNGKIIFDDYLKLLSDRTRIVAVTQVSNALGVILPVKDIIEAAHEMEIPVLVDGAQGIQHGMVDVRSLDCDFYVFSGHKIYGPAGTGVLYGKEKWLEELPPCQGGGDMIKNVTFEKTTYADLPFKFEAGTMNYPGIIALAKALDYISDMGREEIAQREKLLLSYATARLGAIKRLKIYGVAEEKIPTISFLLKNIHQYDTGMILDKMGIAVRTGTHCAQPVMDRFDVEGTVRVSMCFYNTIEEIDLLGNGIETVISMFS